MSQRKISRSKFLSGSLFVTSIVLFLTIISDAQPPEITAESLDRKLRSAVFEGPTEVDRVLYETAKQLYSTSGNDPDMATAAALIDLARERNNAKFFVSQSEDWRLRTDWSGRKTALQKERIRVINANSYFIRLLDKDSITAEDVGRLTKTAKYVSLAIDDARDLSASGLNESDLTRLVKTVNGLTKLVEGTQDRKVGTLIEGFRDTVSSLNRKIKQLGVRPPLNPILSFDVPGEVAMATIDVTRQGFDEANAALSHLTDAIAGDENAVERAIESSQRIQRILSGKTYGEAMLDAIAERIIDRFPFIRTVYNFYEERKKQFWAVNISSDLHHIGDGSYSPTSNSADRFRRKSEGPTFRKTFRINASSIDRAYLMIEELYGHEAGRSTIRVLINLRQVGEITNGKSIRIEIPAKLLKLNGQTNVLQIVAGSDATNDVDDLEFRNVWLEFSGDSASEKPPE